MNFNNTEIYYLRIFKRYKTQTLKYKNIYENTQYLLLSWWYIKSQFKYVYVEQENILVLKHAFGGNDIYR